MGLSSLNAALSGLRISQQQINVISNNVANVGTPGFTRKLLPQYSQAINGETVGVIGGTVIRNVDLNLARDLWTQVSSSGRLGVKETYLNRIQKFHGPPDGELSVAAEISRLKDAFIGLADNPSDPFYLANTVDKAVDAAGKINDLSDLVRTLRNDAQDEISDTVSRINDLLVQIAALNDQVEGNLNIGRTTAQLEDQRDVAIEELSGLIDISFFQRGDGVLVVQSSEGVELATDKASILTFRPSPLSATTFYPDSAAGIYIGDPLTNPTGAVDITNRSPGGKLGGLIELRDVTFPKQTAQLDEMAHKLAYRLDLQGLRLFTDANGNIPADTPPDPSAGPPATSVEYVGFASEIKVNDAILNDNTLLQKGTYGATINPGSNDVLRRVVEFGFGNVHYEEAIGNTYLQGVVDLQDWLGLDSSNQMSFNRDLAAFPDIADLIASANGDLDPPTNTFRITLDDPDVAGGPFNIDVDLSAVADTGGTAADDLVAHINGLLGGLPAGFTFAASVNASGEVVIDTNVDITIDSTVVGNAMGTTGLSYLGLGEGTVEATDPYFEIAVGNNDLTRIYIPPGFADTDLLAALQAVPGLAVEDFTNVANDGLLRLRPGDDYTDPDFGGDIRIVGGPFTTNGASLAATPTGLAAIDDGVNIVSALFGSYSISGTIISDDSPVTSQQYQSETFAGSGVFVTFREEYLGPGVDISTNIKGAQRITDFGQKMVNEHTQELLLTQARLEDEETLRDILQQQLLNESGVNLDEELGNLIVVQTAYAAAARVINAIDELFQDLLNAVA